MTNKTNRDFLKPREVAELVGLTVQTVRALPLGWVRIGPRSLRVRRLDLDSFLAARRA